ncbi:MAG: MOSC domain-containing protein [Bdellovibrionales bacterium]
MAEEKLPMVQELNIYPIKSFRGLRQNELHIDKSGAIWDRQWMLIDDKNTFISQRQMPELAKIGVAFDDVALELSVQEHGSIDFGLEEQESKEFNVKIWKAEVPAFEVSGEVSEWISKVVGKKVRLVRMSSSAKRLFDADNAESTLRFTDTRPLLVIGRASLEQLEKKANVTLSMSRFRPNIVLNHIPPHAEDGYTSINIGGMEFKASKPCTRCKITTVHPLTGAVGEEPLKTLATYRQGEKGVTFGYYYTAVKPGVIKLGAPVSPH